MCSLLAWPRVIEQVAGYFAALFFIPAGLTILRSRNCRDLLIQQSGLDSIRSLSWQDFEKLCGEAYRRMGYCHARGVEEHPKLFQIG